MKIQKIYLDMDGVLADFDEGFFNRFGLRSQDAKRMDNTEFWKMIEQDAQDMYRHLPVMEDAWDLWNYVHDMYDCPIEILTAIPRKATMPLAEEHKRLWIKDHFGDIVVNIGPYAIHKQKWAFPGALLIDDKDLNIYQWRDKKGFGILHTSAKETIEELENAGWY